MVNGEEERQDARTHCRSGDVMWSFHWNKGLERTMGSRSKTNGALDPMQVFLLVVIAMKTP
jgi:hypothetical protein